MHDCRFTGKHAACVQQTLTPFDREMYERIRLPILIGQLYKHVDRKDYYERWCVLFTSILQETHRVIIVDLVLSI